MKKFTNFMIEKRFFILSLMLALCIVSAVFIPKVNVNKDLTKYLPDDSEMKKGLDIIEKEFGSPDFDGNIRVMFEDLPADRVSEVKSTLLGLENVKSVDNDGTEKYTKDNYTLFVVNGDGGLKYESEKETKLENDIREAFGDDKVIVQHTEERITTIPPLVVTIAMVLLTVILFVMCASWTEPFLFMFTIGAAVVLNIGTNALLRSVSQTTFSLSAILQLALSMDYSIILMNRYRQAKEGKKVPKEAMKEAYAAALPSIISSGMTTILGLLMLTFMKFKIGADLGLVMAKGVAFSMICVLTVLPCLILVFDKLIEKTPKKVPPLPTRKLANFGYKGRKVLAVVAVVILLGFGGLQFITARSYAEPRDDRIEKRFPSDNPVIVLYGNKDAEKVVKILAEYEKNENVKECAGYANLFAKPLTAEELRDHIRELSDLQGDISPELLDLLDVDMLKLVYAERHPDAIPALTVAEFVTFLNDEVLPDAKMNKHIDSDTATMVGILKKALGNDELSTNLTVHELYSALKGINVKSIQGMIRELDEDLISDIYALHFAKDANFAPEPILLSDLVKHVTKLAGNPAYADQIKGDNLALLKQVAPFTDKAAITAQLPAERLGAALGIEANLVAAVYSMNGVQTMSLHDFIKFINDTILPNPALAAALTPEQKTTVGLGMTVMDKTLADAKVSIAELNQVATFTDKAAITAQLPAEKLGAALGIDANLIAAVYSMNGVQTMSLYDFIKFINDTILPNPSLAAILTPEQKATVTFGKTIMDKTLADESGAMKIDEETVKFIYAGCSVEKDPEAFKLTVKDFADDLSNEAGKRISDEEQKAKIAGFAKLIDAATDVTKFTYEEITELLSPVAENVKEGDMKLVYLLRTSRNEYDDEWKMTTEEFFNNLPALSGNEAFASVIDADTRNMMLEATQDSITAVKKLKGPDHTLMLLNTDLPAEGKVTSDFITGLGEKLGDTESYIIGASAMNVEMEKGFNRDMILITLLTAIAIFIVVAFTFRSILIPLALVLLVQSAVFITVSFSGITGQSMYYLAMLVVQCILMGATIDYAIVFTSYYRNARKTLDVKDSLAAAYEKSIRTIMTSGLIIILATGAIGLSPADPAIAQICLTLSIGTLAAVLLILFILPGTLAATDRSAGKKKEKKIKN